MIILLLFTIFYADGASFNQSNDCFIKIQHLKSANRVHFENRRRHFDFNVTSNVGSHNYV